HPVPDLLTRHTAAARSQLYPDVAGHLAQLRTVSLNPYPTKRADRKYSASPLKSGKTVLVLDDLCDRGRSFEAARAYLSRVGWNAICVSLFKSPEHGYEAVTPPMLAPFTANNPASSAVRVRKVYG